MKHASPDAQGSPTGTISMKEPSVEVNEDRYIINEREYARVSSVVRHAGLSDFSKIPARDRQWYLDRGAGNHRLFEDVELGRDHKFDYDPEIERYRPGHARFLRETGFNALPGGIERLVWSDEYGIAGRLDRLGTIQNRVVLLDYKSSVLPPAAKPGLPTPTAIQSAIYLLLIPGFKFSEVERYGVAIKAGGGYSMSTKYPFSDRDYALMCIRDFRKDNPR